MTVAEPHSQPDAARHNAFQQRQEPKQLRGKAGVRLRCRQVGDMAHAEQVPAPSVGPGHHPKCVS